MIEVHRMRSRVCVVGLSSLLRCRVSSRADLGADKFIDAIGNRCEKHALFKRERRVSTSQSVKQGHFLLGIFV